MKNITLIIFCLFLSKLGLSQEQHIYAASNVKTIIHGSKNSETTNSQVTPKSTGTTNGTIVANLSVSGNGGLNYTIPISVPSGLNGVQPDLALGFDSQSGNGIAGWGWNLAGVSVITRIPSTNFHDNFIDPVDFDLDDRFALDGQRLIVKNGNYGTNGSSYQTERYSNVKIIAYGNHPDSNVQGPKYFKAFYPDGSIAYYGYNDDSRSATDYAISFWENPQGIRINYSYKTSFNTLSIDQITYGSKNTDTPINTIVFEYKTPNIRESTYIGGIKFVRDKIIDEIIIKGKGGVIYKRYTINHLSSNLNYLRVKSISEFYGEGYANKKTITFNYENNYSGSANGLPSRENPKLIENYGGASSLTLNNIAKSNAKVLPLDISGNGEMDFIVYPTTGDNAKEKFWVFNNLQSSINYSDPYNFGEFEEIFPITWVNNSNKIDTGNGILLVQNKNTSDFSVDFNIIGNSLNGLLSSHYTKTWNNFPTSIKTTYSPIDGIEHKTIRTPMEYISGDFNGNGLTDVVAIEKSSNSKTYLINLDNKIPESDFVTEMGDLSLNYSSLNKLFSVDVNGDGKSDILNFSEGNVQVFSLNKTNTNLELLWETTDEGIKLDLQILIGDYNGDGKTDFFIPIANNENDFVMFLSNGKGFDKKDYVAQSFYYKKTDYDGYDGIGTLYDYNLIPIDINGDGKTDIIEYNTITYDNNEEGQQSIEVHINSDKSYSTHYPSFIPTPPIESTEKLKHYPIPIFLSSKQKNGSLEFATISNKWVRSYKSLDDNRKDFTITQIINNGVTTDIKYDQITPGYYDYNDSDYFDSYTPTFNQTYPFVNINAAPSFKVVRELVQNGSDLTRTRRFRYEGAVSHANGLGFMGFNVLKRSNWFGDNVPAIWTISKHNPLLRGAITEQITAANNFSSTPNSYMSKVNYFYDYTLIANPSSPIAPEYPTSLNRATFIQTIDEAEEYIKLTEGFHAVGDYWAKVIPQNEQSGDVGYAGAVDIRLKRMEMDNGLTGVLSTETYVYDEYNNRKSINTVFPGGSRLVSYNYSNNYSAEDSNYHIGRLELMSETMSIYGNTFNTQERYDYNNNLVSKIQRKGNGTSWITQELSYDSYGNVLTKILKSTDPNLNDRIQVFKYDSKYNNRFLTESTSIDGLKTSFEYDPVSGNLIETTDPFGRTSTYLNDEWGRVYTETDYLGNITTNIYSALSDGGLQYNINFPDGRKEEIIYNAFGWPTKTGALSLNNEWTYTSNEYDVIGRTKKESEPHKGSPSQWNTTLYDEYGRPMSQQLYTGRNITTTFSGLTTTVNDGVKSVTTTLDALGNVQKSQDPGGIVEYTYFASGQLKTADYGGNVVTVGVDGWGRKTSLNDPSAGSYSYTYNDFGEVLKETTPKGTTTYEYDSYGKIKQQKIVGDLTDLLLTYEYYESTNKLLKKITGTDNTNSSRAYTYEYEYDTYLRPTVVKENTTLANFEYGTTYDIYGRLNTETQISNLIGGPSKTITTRNVYDTSGILKEIWNDGTPDKLWELNEINARGQAQTVSLGNGITKNKLYDSYGYLKKIEDKKDGDTPLTALHTEYNFNQQRGTLDSRENFGLNWQETFGYDNLDRLTTITGDAVKTMSYDSRGRIDNNTDLGSYAYTNGNSKYQLTDITPNTDGESYFQQHPTQQISYNAFKKPVTIHETGHGRVGFEYSPLMSRSTAYYGGEDEDKNLRRYRKHYSSILPVEIVEDTQSGTTKIITYVAGDAYTAPIAHIKQTGTTPFDEYHYLHRDYLGSILAITDADGDVKEERQFGAWGSVDKFLDSSGNTTFTHDSLLGRGYTGHEHFFEVSLIHMNGRMYDPQLGRFLSPDNYIQDPFNTQNYNRYAYVLNNPLMYTDASGESWEAALVVIAAVIAAASATVGVYALIKNYTDTSTGSIKEAAPSPNNVQNNSKMASSMSRQSSGNSNLNDGGWIPLNIPAIDAGGNSYTAPPVFNNMSSQDSGTYGVSQLGSQDPLQGIPVPDNFVPNDGLDDQNFNITAEDVLDTALDFVPIAGGIKDIYRGIQSGNGWMVALGAGSIVLDVFTLGGSSLAKGAIKTGLKVGGRTLFKKGATLGSVKLLTQGAKALHKHHVFPQQFRKWFSTRGINNIDDYAVTISQSTHLKGVHGKGLGNLPGRWNQRWIDFIKSNPNASPSEIFYHGESLLREYGLEYLPYVKYK